MPLFSSIQIPGKTAKRFGLQVLPILAAMIACSLVAFGLSPAHGAAPEPKPAARPAKPLAPTAKPAATNSLDDALLDDLDNELLDGIKDLPTKKRPNRGGQKPANSGQPTDDPDGSKETAPDSDNADEAAGDEEMTEDRPGADEEPLIRIGQQMRTAEKLLQRKQAAEGTEQVQEQILSDLAALIKKLEQQCQSQSSSDSKPSNSQNQQASRDSVKQPKPGSGNPGSQQSNKPAKESTERLGKNDTQKPDLDAIKGLLKDAWGQLPPHSREQMLQSPPEQFLPKYELLIEKYYKRLAEQQNQKP